jgi:HEPN domain-containing protein
MLTRAELQGLAKVRLREAEALHGAGLYDGCAYLCGYVLEIALKAVICKALSVQTYPAVDKGSRDLFKTHDFDTLILLAGLRERLKNERSANSSLDRNWVLLATWSPDKRYESGTLESEAMALLDGLRSQDGVFTWLLLWW